MSNEELVRLYQSGDKTALNKLVEQNERIVYKLANKFYTEKTNSVDKEDLIQEGFLGLMVAADKYKIDIEHPCKFSTYAVYWVYQKISRFIKTRNTNAEISINAPMKSDNGDNDKELIENIVVNDSSFESVEDKIYNEQLREELETVMNKHNTLTEREILKLHYGWDNNKCMSLKDVALILGVNPKSIGGFEFKAMGKIRRTPWGVKKAEEIYHQKLFESKYSINKIMDTINFVDKYLNI